MRVFIACILVPQQRRVMLQKSGRAHCKHNNNIILTCALLGTNENLYHSIGIFVCDPTHSLKSFKHNLQNTIYQIQFASNARSVRANVLLKSCPKVNCELRQRATNLNRLQPSVECRLWHPWNSRIAFQSSRDCIHTQRTRTARLPPIKAARA